MAQRMGVTGIYRVSIVRPDLPDLIYIGQACDIARRKSVHLWELNSGKHKNRRLQNAYRRYGAASFRHEILEICAAGRLADAEQEWLDAEILRVGKPMVCNVRLECVVSGKGTKFSVETCAKISKALKGRTVSQEWRERLSKARTGQKLTEEQRRAHSEVLRKCGNMTRVISPSQREIASRTHRGKAISEAHKAALREANTGRKQTAEAIEKSALKRRGGIRSAETRERIRQKALGRTISPETIAKMNASRAATRARKAAEKQAELSWSQSKGAQL